MVSETEKRIPLFDNYINQNISIEMFFGHYSLNETYNLNQFLKQKNI